MSFCAPVDSLVALRALSVPWKVKFGQIASHSQPDHFVVSCADVHPLWRRIGRALLSRMPRSRAWLEGRRQKERAKLRREIGILDLLTAPRATRLIGREEKY